MNFIYREDAVIADKMVQLLADKGRQTNTLTSISEKELADLLNIDIHNVRSILEIANNCQYQKGFRAFDRTLSAIDTSNDTYGFLRNGGFIALWDDENMERLSKQKVDIVNESVLQSNKVIRLVSYITAVTSFVSLIVAILAYNNTADINVKSLPQQPIQIHPVPIPYKSTDTLHHSIPVFLPKIPTSSSKTSK